MEIVPVINCADRMRAELEVETLAGFLERDHFVHIDVADGVFTFHKTWNAPTLLKRLVHGRFRLEAHLMVEHPPVWLMPWLAAGVTRFVVHVEAIDTASFLRMKRLCDQHGATLMLTSNPETPVWELASYLGVCSAFQVLSVHPGLSGQPFLPLTLDKVRWIRRKAPHGIIEVDGGITPATARLAKSAGADIIVSATDIFGSADPKREYEVLKKI
jgi:ribulose-phosphate 3-epimerase